MIFHMTMSWQHMWSRHEHRAVDFKGDNVSILGQVEACNSHWYCALSLQARTWPFFAFFFLITNHLKKNELATFRGDASAWHIRFRVHSFSSCLRSKIQKRSVKKQMTWIARLIPGAERTIGGIMLRHTTSERPSYDCESVRDNSRRRATQSLPPRRQPIAPEARPWWHLSSGVTALCELMVVCLAVSAWKY